MGELESARNDVQSGSFAAAPAATNYCGVKRQGTLVVPSGSTSPQGVG